MNWFTRMAQAFRPRAANSITRAADLQELIDTALGGLSSSGLRVGAAQALQQAAVSSALLVLGETLAQLPFQVMRRRPGDGNQVVEDHLVQRLLSRHGHPNAWMTSFEFRELAVRHVATRGNFFAFKNSARGVLRELLPIHPKRVQAEMDDDFRIINRVNMGKGARRTFGPAEILHLRGPSDDGFLGLDRMQQHKDTIGLGLAQDLHAGKVFANGARIAGVLEREGTPLKTEAFDRLKKQFNEIYAGPENAHKVAILEEGMKFSKSGMTAEEGQLLESRKLQRSVIAALWRVPPHMVGDLEKATFSNIENLARQFVDYGLVPWIERQEQAYEMQLLTDAERADGLFVMIDPAGLLRGDSKARAEFYSKLISSRVINPNEAREMEGLAPYEGGDEFANPNITTSSGDPADDPEQEPREDPENAPDEPGSVAPIPIRA